MHFAFKQLLRDREFSQQDPDTKAAMIADLDQLIELGQRYLSQSCKDLVVAAWMVEALSLKCRFAVRDGRS